MLCVALTTWHSHQCSISHGLKEKKQDFSNEQTHNINVFR